MTQYSIGSCSQTTPTPTGGAPGGKTITIRANVNDKLVAATDTGDALQAEGSTIGDEDRYQVVGNSDGTFSLKSRRTNQYVAVNSSSRRLFANASSITAAAKFRWRATAGYADRFAFESVLTGQYVTAESSGDAPLIANRDSAGSWEQFVWDENP